MWLWWDHFYHSSYNVSENAMMRNRKRTGAVISPWLTPTLKGMEVSIFPIISLTTCFHTLFWSQKKIGEEIHICRGWKSGVCYWRCQKRIPDLKNANQLGRLWLFCKCSRVFKVKLPYWHPTPRVPNWYLTLCDFIIFNARSLRILLKHFSPISTRVMPRHLLGSDRYPLFGTGKIWPSYHS